MSPAERLQRGKGTRGFSISISKNFIYFLIKVLQGNFTIYLEIPPTFATLAIPKFPTLCLFLTYVFEYSPNDCLNLPYMFLPLHLCSFYFFHCDWTPDFCLLRYHHSPKAQFNSYVHDEWSDSYCAMTKSDLLLFLSNHYIHLDPQQIQQIISCGTQPCLLLDFLFVLEKKKRTKKALMTESFSVKVSTYNLGSPSKCLGFHEMQKVETAIVGLL